MEYFNCMLQSCENDTDHQSSKKHHRRSHARKSAKNAKPEVADDVVAMTKKDDEESNDNDTAEEKKKSKTAHEQHRRKSQQSKSRNGRRKQPDEKKKAKTPKKDAFDRLPSFDLAERDDDEIEVVSEKIKSIIASPAHVFSCSNISADDLTALHEVVAQSGFATMQLREVDEAAAGESKMTGVVTLETSKEPEASQAVVAAPSTEEQKTTDAATPATSTAATAAVAAPPASEKETKSE